MLRSYGPTGSATGWRLWIDGWALAQHEPVIAAHFRQLEAHSRSTLRALVDEGLADGTMVCADPDASVSRLLALLDGLSVAAEVFGSVSRAQLRRWLDGAIAAELGLIAGRGRRASACDETRNERSGPARGFVTGLRPSSTSERVSAIDRESVVVHH